MAPPFAIPRWIRERSFFWNIGRSFKKTGSNARFATVDNNTAFLAHNPAGDDRLESISPVQ